MNQNKNDVMIELPENELIELVKKLKNCQKDKEKLIETVKYLNKQIENYNKMYANDSKGDLNEN
jgi:uncharacterized FlaG/YvyC family protein